MVYAGQVDLASSVSALSALHRDVLNASLRNASAVVAAPNSMVPQVSLAVAAPVAQPWPAETAPANNLLVEIVLLIALAAGSMRLLLPMRSALSAARDRELSVKELLVEELLPNYLLFGQCYFWACHGYYGGLPDLLRFNAAGAGVCISYLFIVLKPAQEERKQLRGVLLAAVGFLLASSASLAIPSSSVAGGQAFGLMATLCSATQCGVPFLPVVEGKKTRLSQVGAVSSRRAGLTVAAASVASSMLWAQYAFVERSLLSPLAELAALLVALSELSLVAWALYASRQVSGDGCPDADHRPLMPRAARKLAGNPMGLYCENSPGALPLAGFTLDAHCRSDMFSFAGPDIEVLDGGRPSAGRLATMSPFTQLKAEAREPETGEAEAPELEPGLHCGSRRQLLTAHGPLMSHLAVPHRPL